MSDARCGNVTIDFVGPSAVLLLDGAPLLSGVGGVPAGSAPQGTAPFALSVAARGAAESKGACAPTVRAEPVEARARPAEAHARPSQDVLDVLHSIAQHLEPTRYGRPRPFDPCRELAAFLLDGLLVRVVRGRDALDLAIGDGLAALAVGDRALRLGCSGIGDYARERLGIAAGTALSMAGLARKLRERPLLRDAVRRGDVSARKAQTVLAVARGEAEAGWVERARVETVRALRAAVAAEVARGGGRDSAESACAGRSGPDCAAIAPTVLAEPVEAREGAQGIRCGSEPEEEAWERIVIPLAPEDRAPLDEAMALAGELLGATTPKWRRLEAICEEYLGAHPVEPDADEKLALLDRTPVDDWLEQAKAVLEEETDRWCFLERAERFVAPESPSADDPWRLDAELRELAAMRERWDALVGQLAMLLKHGRLTRAMQFARFSHYCEERLGVSARAVEQRAALARRLYSLPALREALQAGRISYEQARLVARVADEDTERAWIARAERTTCIALGRELESAEDAQMCRRNELSLRVPCRVSALVAAAVRAASEVEGTRLAPGRALGLVARHFVDTWRPALATRSTPARRAIARDRGFCQVPGCSRAAVHAHHVVFRSRGGGDEEANLVSLCAGHHLHGVHGGVLRVRGRAPEALEWELGLAGVAGVC